MTTGKDVMKWVVMVVGGWAGMMGGARGADQEQQFTLISLQGDTERVTLDTDMSGSYFGGFLLVRVNSVQQLCLENYNGLTSARVLDQRFLELRFNNAPLQNTACGEYTLLCISDGRLHAAFYNLGYDSTEGPPYACPGKELDSMTFENWELHTALQHTGTDYSLIVSLRHQIESPCGPPVSLDTTSVTVLSFNREFGVFCNSLDTVSGQFFGFYEDDSPTMLRESVVCPVVTLEVPRDSGFTPWDLDQLYFERSWCRPDGVGRWICTGRECER